MADGPAIAARGLGRRFGAREALRGVDLRVEPGAIAGLAGPNGSGKTTLLELVAGLLRPSSGELRVLGLAPFQERVALMRRARFAFAPPALYGRMTAREHLRALGGLGGPRPSRTAVDRVLELTGIGDRAAEPVRVFSLGMRQRLALALALLPIPELLVLDEPAEGLDPLAVLELRAVLARLRAEHGVTVLLSSHLLLELDELVDELFVLDGGEVLCHGPPAALRGPPVAYAVTSDDAAAAALLSDRGAGIACSARGLELGGGAAPALAELQALLAPRGIAVLEYGRRAPTLESAVLARLRARREEAR